MCFLGLYFSFFFLFSLLQKRYLKDRFAHVKNWTWRTAICSQVAKHTRPSEAVGTGPSMKLHLPTDKAETQPGDLLKTRQTESTAFIISTKVSSWWGQCFICCCSWNCWLQNCHNFISSFTFFSLSNHPRFWCRASMFSKDGWLLPVYLMFQGCTLFSSLIL